MVACGDWRSTDVEVLVNQIVFEEALISEGRKPQLRRLVYKLIEKLESNDSNDFFLYKILRAHILPLTNCAFNKSGDKCVWRGWSMLQFFD